jgi:hypothetical protein
VATQLYTAVVDLKIRSFVADWPCPAGRVVPLDPSKASTQALLAAGKITLAPPGSTDTSTPPHTLRGQPGIKTAVAN